MRLAELNIAKEQLQEERLEFVGGEERIKSPEIEKEEVQEQNFPKHEELIPEIEEENFENLDLPEAPRGEKYEDKESRAEESPERNLAQESPLILDTSQQAKSNLATMSASEKRS